MADAPEIPESLQFLDSYTRSFLVEFQRLIVTIVLLFCAAPKAITAGFSDYFSPYFHQYVSDISGFLTFSNDDHPWRVLLTVLLIFLLIQIVIIIHSLLLKFFNTLLPDMYFRIYLKDPEAEEAIFNIRQLTKRFYSNLNGDDFWTLYAINFSKDVDDWNTRARAIMDAKADMFAFIKERILIFVLIASLASSHEYIWIGAIAVCLLFIISVWRESVRTYTKQQGLVDVNSTTSLRLIHDPRAVYDTTAPGAKKTGQSEVKRLIFEAKLWFVSARFRGRELTLYLGDARKYTANIPRVTSCKRCFKSNSAST